MPSCNDEVDSLSLSKTVETESKEFQERVAEVEYYVREELRSYTFGGSKKFIDTFFPEAFNGRTTTDIHNILKTGKSPAFNDSRWPKQWAGFPNMGVKLNNEKSLYAPFVNAANAICMAVNPTYNPRTARQKFTPRLRWRAMPNLSPQSLQTSSSKMRPDIMGILGPIPESTDKKNPQRLPWRQILVPVEVKKSNCDKPAALQLFKYLRQIFCEAPDRRFIFGLVLAKRMVTVWLVDRSGAFGAEEFDMHKEPEKLIRVIAGFECMELHRLGLDTTMRMIPAGLTDLTHVSPVFSHSLNPTEFPNYVWLMTVQMCSMSDTTSRVAQRELEDSPNFVEQRFVLFSVISFHRGEVIRGRATRIWAAWKWEDMYLPPEKRKIYIVKDTWRDVARPYEGSFYRRLANVNGIAKMHGYGPVRIEGDIDSTATLIRRGLVAQGRNVLIEAKQKPRESMKNVRATSPDGSPRGVSKIVTKIRDDNGATFTVPAYDISHDFLPEDNGGEASRAGGMKTGGTEFKLQNRIHSRVVFATHGWPVKYFKHCLELCQVLRSALRALREAYSLSVAHRDVSPGNILIIDDGSETAGCLIDFDNAVFLDPYKPVASDDLSGTWPFVSGERLESRRYYPDHFTEEVQVIHAYHHDAESVFWVLVFLVIYREGPGRRREELRNDDRTSSSLTRAFGDLFEKDRNSLATMKRLVIKNRDEFRFLVLPHISRFCSPLATLVAQFYEILHIAYFKNDFSKLADDIDNLFQTHETTLSAPGGDPSQSQEYEEYRKAEEDRRALVQAGEERMANSPTLQPLQLLTEVPEIEAEETAAPPKKRRRRQSDVPSADEGPQTRSRSKAKAEEAEAQKNTSGKRRKKAKR